jgi:hypothetical protein
MLLNDKISFWLFGSLCIGLGGAFSNDILLATIRFENIVKINIIFLTIMKSFGKFDLERYEIKRLVKKE